MNAIMIWKAAAHCTCSECCICTENYSASQVDLTDLEAQTAIHEKDEGLFCIVLLRGLSPASLHRISESAKESSCNSKRNKMVILSLSR
eukprot:scaffold355_cov127-Skeletonema_dohrnii-CCMP3373.AAC.6